MDLSLKPRKPETSITKKESGEGKKNQRKKLWWEVPLGIFIGLVLVFGGLLVYKTVIATNKIITDNLSGSAPAFLDDVDPRALKGEGDGRVNILLLGMGGVGHSGTYLTDTIIVVSVDPENKDVAMLSIPRDFYLYVPDYGYSRINAAYTAGLRSDKESGGLAMTKEVVSDLLDINIHYGLAIDFNGFEEIVDALGGVTVDVEKNLYDSQYPTESGGYQTVIFNKGIQKMDGEDALKFARSRKSTSDFDRAKRQQQIMVSIKEKALSIDTLLNPTKISSFIDALGNHMKTDIQLWEIQRLIDIFKEIDTSSIVNKVISPEEGLVKTTMINGASVVVPVTGDYSEIRKFAHEIFVDNYLIKEKAGIAILNGSYFAGLAQNLAGNLESYNYNVVKVDNADNKKYTKTVIYDNTNGEKPYTIEFLKKRLEKFGIYPQVKKSDSYSDDITIILGSDYKSQ